MSLRYAALYRRTHAHLRCALVRVSRSAGHAVLRVQRGVQVSVAVCARCQALRTPPPPRPAPPSRAMHQGAQPLAGRGLPAVGVRLHDLF